MHCHTTKPSISGYITCDREAEWELVGSGHNPPLLVCSECGKMWLTSPYYPKPLYNLSLKRLDSVEPPSVVPQCLECKGSGVYHGFTVIEQCKRCSGTGLIN